MEWLVAKRAESHIAVFTVQELLSLLASMFTPHEPTMQLAACTWLA